ncbi:MAG: alpha/beta hydrolase [Eubacterium sp.]|nr:alpha/beta hydrolase [Eubacterium sp.]
MSVNREIAFEGLLLKAISPLPYEKAQRFIGPLSTKAMGLLPLKSLNCKKIKIERGDGSAFRACVMRGKKTEGKTIGVLWLHGGGYSLGAPEMAIMSFPRQLINNCNCVVVSPDYTLSSVKPYPAALNDAFTALLWLKENRKALGITCEKLVVGGESAGGGLTAALCIFARDKGEDCIGLQIPLYPMLDDRVTESSKHNTAPVWNTKANKSAWRIYLGDSVMNNGVSPYAAPARETDFGGLPPAISFIGTEEPFYDETLAFFEKLRNAGVDAALKEYKGGYHAFDMLAPYASISKDANRYLLAQYLKFTEKYILD